jgi:hypothetical protein
VEADLGWIISARVFATVAALCAFGWALRRLRREFSEQLERVLAAQQQSRAEVQALAERITALSTLVAALPARSERPVEAAPPAPPMPRRSSAPVRSYETARRLAKSGATVEEIVATCGIAGTEARLLQRLLGPGSPRDNAA